GSCMPDEKRSELVELLAAHDVPLIEDDIIGDLGFAGDRPHAAKAFDRKGLVLLCCSYSKTIWPGYREGWVAPGRFQAAIAPRKFSASGGSAPLPQLVVAEFRQNGGYDHHIRRIRRVYARHVAQLSAAVLRWFPASTRISRPRGGFVLWIELPEHVDALALYERALRAGITLNPGPVFSPRQGFRNFIRLSAARWKPALEEAVATLGGLVGEMASGECGDG